MFVQTISQSQTINNRSYRIPNPTYSHNNAITLAELQFTNEHPARICGIQPSLRLNMRQTVSQIDFLFCGNGVDVMAGRVPSRMTLLESANFSKNINASVQYGKPKLIVFIGQNTQFLDGLHRSLFGRGYHVDRRIANGMEYFVATARGVPFNFPNVLGSENTFGTYIRYYAVLARDIERAARGRKA